MSAVTETQPDRIHDPGYHTDNKAIVLGAREGNIGGAIAEKLCQCRWIAVEDDCYRSVGIEWKYMPPPIRDLVSYNACIITLGTTHMEPFIEVSQEDFSKVVYGSLELPLECARRYVRARTESIKDDAIRKDGILEPWRGRIVFIGSYAHNHPFTHCTSYCVAKAGLDMAAKSLAWELMPEGFDVHIIHPHHVQGTPMTDKVLKGMQEGVHKMTPTEARRYQHKDLRMPNLLKPEEIAEMVRLLLCEPAMRWVSGTGIEMYGGMR